MTYYRSHPLDLSTRMTLATEMLLPRPERPWGHVTYLSSQYGVSRTWLYELRHRALEAVCAAVAPRRPGPAPAADSVRIDRPFVQRAITVLPLLKGTVRGIQEGLDLLFGVKRSVGHISETLQRAGDVAAEMNAAVTIPYPVLAEADEIFQGQHPCLTVVDGRSFVVLNLKAEAQRDATTWGVTFLSLQEQGIRMHDLVSDGAKGIRSGIKETQLTIPLRLDFFHLLREAHTVAQRLQRIAYRAMERRKPDAPKPKRDTLCGVPGVRYRSFSLAGKPKPKNSRRSKHTISLYGWCGKFRVPPSPSPPPDNWQPPPKPSQPCRQQPH